MLKKAKGVKNRFLQSNLKNPKSRWRSLKITLLKSQNKKVDLKKINTKLRRSHLLKIQKLSLISIKSKLSLLKMTIRNIQPVRLAIISRKKGIEKNQIPS